MKNNTNVFNKSTLVFLLNIAFSACVYGMLPQAKPLLKIQGSDAIAEIPWDIANNSKTIAAMLNDLGGIPELPLPLNSYSSYIIKQSFNVVSKTYLADNELDKYVLEQVIPIVNCIQHLDFPDNMPTRQLIKKIYQSSKGYPYTTLVSIVSSLYSDLVPQALADPVINRLKLLLIEKSLTQDSIVINSEIGNSEIFFSPDNKMIAGKANNEYSEQFIVENINGPQVVARQKIDMPAYRGATFMNNKKLAIMAQENIFIYGIDENGIIKDKPLQKLIIPSPSPSTVSRGRDQIISNEKCMASTYQNNCFLWGINTDGSINPDPYHVIKNEQIICEALYDDSLAIVSINKVNESVHLSVFNTDGTLNFNFPLSPKIKNVDFYSDDKKFIADDQFALFLYDFNDKGNITRRRIFLTNKHIVFCRLILNSNATALQSWGKLLLIDMNNIKNPPAKMFVDDGQVEDVGFSINKNNTSMISFKRRRNTNLLYLLISHQEELVLDQIKTLTLDKILLIDKMIDKAPELPVLVAPIDILELLKKLNVVEPETKPEKELSQLIANFKKLSLKQKSPESITTSLMDDVTKAKVKKANVLRQRKLLQSMKAQATQANARPALTDPQSETNKFPNSPVPVIEPEIKQPNQPDQANQLEDENPTEEKPPYSGIFSFSGIKSFFSTIKGFFNLLYSIILNGTTSLP